MKKRLLSLFLVVVMTFSVSIPAFAVEIEKAESLIDSRIMSLVEAKIDASNVKININMIKNLKDFAGNEYKLVECLPTGYYIIHPESGIVIESSPSAKSPYDGFDSNLYYGGPTYYYVKSQGDYVHTVLDTVLDNNKFAETVATCNVVNNELISQININVTNYIDGNSSNLPLITDKASGNDYWVTNYTWFKNLKSKFGYMYGGYCGYIAANLILKYFDDRGKIDLPSPYNTVNSTALTQELIDIGDDLGYGAGTWAYDIADVINEFCSQQNILEEASWAIGVAGLNTEIKSNKRPCILFGNLDAAGNHAVVAYGYNDYENSGYNTMICHYGWNGNYSEIHVYGGTSIFGSNTKYKI